MANRTGKGGNPSGKGGFKKGQSGNPGGRKAVPDDVRRAAAEYTMEAIERLAYWMRSDNPTASVAATDKLLCRAHGMPNQTLSNPDGAALIVQVIKQG